MRISTIRKMIKEGEGLTLEFKESTGSLREAFKTICAFLNTAGGTVLFGVTDSGKLVGQHVSEKTIKDISASIRQIQPSAEINMHRVAYEGKEIIALSVDEGENKPYSYDGRFYSRHPKETIRMPSEEFNFLVHQKNPEVWEGLTNNNCTIKDLDQEKIRELVKIGESIKNLPLGLHKEPITNILKYFKLIEDSKLTNAAVILFCKNHFKQFLQSNAQLARFKGTTKAEFLEKKKFNGCIFQLFDEMIKFLDSNIPMTAYIKEGKMHRIERPIIPEKVLREAVINALTHRDYSDPAGFIKIAMDNNGVVIANTGALLRGVSLNQLNKEHYSILRNPLIGEFMFRVGLIEQWGRGTNDIINLSKEAGNPVPIFEEIDSKIFVLTLPFKEPIRHVEEVVVKSLTDRQQDIIKLLSKGPLMSGEIMDALRLDVTNRSMQRELIKLKELGHIKSTGKTKKLIWSLT